MQKRKPTLVGPETWGRRLFVAMKSFRPETPLTMFDWIDPADYVNDHEDMIHYLPVKATNFLLGEPMRKYFKAKPVLYERQEIAGRIYRVLPYPDTQTKLMVAKTLLTELGRW